MKRHRMKTMVFAVLLTIAAAFGWVTPAEAAVFHTDVRVLLTAGSSEPLEVRIVGDFYIKEAPDFDLDAEEIIISVAGSRPVLTADSRTLTAAAITFISMEYHGTSSYTGFVNRKYGYSTYLGNMQFDVVGGEIRAINTLPIEKYLYGVVPYEMSNAFPVESLKAQAVCARGYAVANCSIYGQRDYDIGDTSSDQVYHGYVSKYTRAIAAVEETAGKILTSEGEIIQAYYSASNGGQTEMTGNVWTSDLPYYVQRDDPYDLSNPSSPEQMSFIPGVFDAETTALMDPLVLAMLQQGANDAAGEEVTLLETVRIKARDAIYAPPSRSYTKADVTLMVRDAGGRTGQLTFTISLDDLVFSDDNPDGIFNIEKPRMRMRGAERGVLVSEDMAYDGWLITNRRYGHGVGLSQRGAQQRATSGQTYEEILYFYYANTQLHTVGTFDSAPVLVSDKYDISETGIGGIPPGTRVDKLLSRMTSDGDSISLVTSKGAPKTEGAAATGDFVRTVYEDGLAYFDLAVVVYGDTDGDGEISQDDATALRQHLLGAQHLTGPYLAAADVNHDGAVDSRDVLAIIKHTHRTYEISESAE